jgi:hypothetical protein
MHRHTPTIYGLCDLLFSVGLVEIEEFLWGCLEGIVSGADWNF